MAQLFNSLPGLARWIFLSALTTCLTACASYGPKPPSGVEALPAAISLPYRISDEGHLIVDVSVNDQAPRPFMIDSGANITAIYEDAASRLGLTASGEFTSVRGLVATADRPISDQVNLKLGSKIFLSNRVVLLETPKNPTGVAGLLGVDVLGGHAALFNKATGMMTLVPSTQLSPKDFKGWRRIGLKNSVGTYPDKGLYFSKIFMRGQPAPVLIDTGSSINFINWQLANKDEKIKRLRKSLDNILRLQGANEKVPLRMHAEFLDVELGAQDWPIVRVVVLEFDTLSDIAPTHRPMMLAGVGLFSPSTFLFDFGGNAIYIWPYETGSVEGAGG